MVGTQDKTRCITESPFNGIPKAMLCLIPQTESCQSCGLDNNGGTGSFLHINTLTPSLAPELSGPKSPQGLGRVDRIQSIGTCPNTRRIGDKLLGDRFYNEACKFIFSKPARARDCQDCLAPFVITYHCYLILFPPLMRPHRCRITLPRSLLSLD